MRRHTITLGSSTSTGGKVIAASSNGSIHGVQIALEGDLIFCPACKSKGKIQCVGPRIPERWNGKHVALENDLCICGCTIPPKLIPSQFVRYQTITDNVPKTAARGQANTPSHAYDLSFLIKDINSGTVLAGIPYKITLPTGRTLIGTTDASGRTGTISSDTPDIATIEVPYYGHATAESHAGCKSDACNC